MSDATLNVYTFQIGLGSEGHIERLCHSANWHASNISDAAKLARAALPAAETTAGANVMRLLDDNQAVVWWRPFPSN